MRDTIRCFIGMGSNLNNPIDQIQQAITELNDLTDSTMGMVSSLYRSAPMGPQDQPDFINAVAELFTKLRPEELLDKLQLIEQHHRRVRQRHWGERTLDLDILLYGEQQLKTERLTVPHAGLTERNFVLFPLAEIAPELIIPPATTLFSLLSKTSTGSLQKIQV